MKIKNICIDYFRGLQKVSIQKLDDHLNLFVGVNGAGKSSILDSIALVFSWYVARILSAKGRGKDIPTDDISIHSPNGCTIELGLDDGTRWKLYRSLKYKKTDKSDLSALTRFAASLREQIDNDTTATLPVVIHYGVNRVIPNKYPRMPRGKNNHTSLSTYKNALGSSQLFTDFFNWFRLSEDYENERYKENQQFRDLGLEAVRKAMSQVFPDYSGMKVSRRPLSLVMQKSDEVFKINQLSDGEKCYITLVCDIARRLAIANPTGDPLKGDGIILIDEIDLHLHPKWQQTVISKLVKAFPNCQFFITTHSPIVASDAQGAVFGIKDGLLYPQQTFGKLSSNILSSVFDVSMARSLYVQAMIEDAYTYIKEEKDNEFEKMLEKLTDILGADDLDITRLKIEKMRRERARHK